MADFNQDELQHLLNLSLDKIIGDEKVFRAVMVIRMQLGDQRMQRIEEKGCRAGIDDRVRLERIEETLKGKRNLIEIGGPMGFIRGCTLNQAVMLITLIGLIYLGVSTSSFKTKVTKILAQVTSTELKIDGEIRRATGP